MIFKARYRQDLSDDYQQLSVHLEETAALAGLFAQKIGLEKIAILAGLTHDLGKNCESWAAYLEESHETEKKNS